MALRWAVGAQVSSATHSMLKKANETVDSSYELAGATYRICGSAERSEETIEEGEEE